MEPNYFLFLILPLAVFVFILVALVIRMSRTEEDEYEKQEKKLRKLLFSGKLDKKTFATLKNRVKYVKHFNGESKKLVSLLSDEKIDKETYARLMKVLEKSFKDRLDKLENNTNDVCNKEPFDASKF